MWPQFEREIISSASEEGLNHRVSPPIVTRRNLDSGTYIINNTAANDVDDHNIDSIVRALKEFGEHFEFVNPKEIPNYYPSQRSRALQFVNARLVNFWKILRTIVSKVLNFCRIGHVN